MYKSVTDRLDGGLADGTNRTPGCGEICPESGMDCLQVMVVAVRKDGKYG